MLDIKKTNKTDTLIQELLNIYEQDLPGIWKISPAQTSLEKNYLHSIQELEKLRGRALLYPYLGWVMERVFMLSFWMVL